LNFKKYFRDLNILILNLLCQITLKFRTSNQFDLEGLYFRAMGEAHCKISTVHSGLKDWHYYIARHPIKVENDLSSNMTM
jgi:hypothetical protein